MASCEAPYPFSLTPYSSWPLSSWAQPFLQPLPRRRAAIMERAEPRIEREIDTAIIALEIAVVKLVMKMSDHHPAAPAEQ